MQFTRSVTHVAGQFCYLCPRLLTGMPSADKVRRVSRVTLAVAALGAAGGALSGIVIASIFVGVQILASPSPSPFIATLQFFVFASAYAATFGVMFGVVLGPLFAWTLLRRAPLWRAIGETSFAAAVDTGIASATIIGSGSFWFVPVGCALIAALRLQWEVRGCPPAEDRAATG